MSSPFIYGANGATSLVPGGVTLPGSTSGTIQIQPASTTTSYVITLPAAQAGAANETLLNNGSGVLSWALVPVPSTGDINETSFSASNNVSSAANVTGLAFASASVGSFDAMVQVYVNASTPLRQVFNIQGSQTGAGGWKLTQSSTGDESGFIFTITSAGQVQYTNSNYTGFSAATIKFRAWAISA